MLVRGAVILLAWLIGAAAPAREGQGPRFFEMTEADLDAQLARLQQQWPELPQRVAEVSAGFLGVDYRVSPLGEGPGRLPDPDPLIRLDAVDCLTFVEETLALALSVNLKQAAGRLQCIRYLGGEVDYLKRKHFVTAQWLPENQRQGWLRDITAELGGDDVTWISKTLDAGAWDRRHPGKNWPLLTADQIPKGSFRLSVVPLDKAEKILRGVPSGSIMLVVRRDEPDRPVLVSHLGLMVRKGDSLFLRHASRRAGQVVDELLTSYLGKLRLYRHWPVAGLNWQLPSAGRGAKMPQVGLEHGCGP